MRQALLSYGARPAGWTAGASGAARAVSWVTILLAGLAGLAGACAKGSTGDGAPTSASGPAAPSAVPSASPSSPAAGRAPPAAPTGLEEWKGAYKSVPGTIVLPRDVKWKIPNTTAGIGEGTIALTVDRATGRVRGKVDGVLGPAAIDGVAADGKIAANVSRDDPTDHGFTGTLSGDLGDAGTQGTMNVALADVSAVRNATFALAPVP
jgi:hypothetical protein